MLITIFNIYFNYMDYIYIDESGELAKKSNYFVIGAYYS